MNEASSYHQLPKPSLQIQTLSKDRLPVIYSLLYGSHALRKIDMSGYHSHDVDDDDTVAVRDAVFMDAGHLPSTAAAATVKTVKTRMVSCHTITNVAGLATTTTTAVSTSSKRKATPDDRNSEATLPLPKTPTGEGATATPAAAAAAVYITEPGPDDVLLGRGAPIINYVGNVKFRTLVRSRKNDYITSGRHKIKDKVAKSILREIQRRGGRFLKRIGAPNKSDVVALEDMNQTTTDGISSTSYQQKVYQIAEFDVALEKVKQALRDKDTDQQQCNLQQPLQQQFQRRQEQKTQDVIMEASQQQLGLEELAAASGISTLTALQQQLCEALRSSSHRSDVLRGNHHPGSTMNSSSDSFSLPSVPSRNSHHDNNNLSLMNEFMRYQQQQLLPLQLQERQNNNTEGINLRNQQFLVQQQSHLQDQQNLLAILRQDSNNATEQDLRMESFHRPLTPATIQSLFLQRSNNHELRNTTERVDSDVDLDAYLQQRNQQQHYADLLLQQQLTNINTSIQNPSNLFGSPNIRLSQLAANLVAQRQYVQYNAN